MFNWIGGGGGLLDTLKNVCIIEIRSGSFSVEVQRPLGYVKVMPVLTKT